MRRDFKSEAHRERFQILPRLGSNSLPLDWRELLRGIRAGGKILSVTTCQADPAQQHDLRLFRDHGFPYRQGPCNHRPAAFVAMIGGQMQVLLRRGRNFVVEVAFHVCSGLLGLSRSAASSLVTAEVSPSV
jgi:hypothetical protein